MKLTRKQLNILIENFLFEKEEKEEPLENLIVPIEYDNRTDSNVKVKLTNLGSRIQAHIEENGKLTKLNTEKGVEAALFGALSHAYDTMKDADDRKLLVKWIEATVDGGIETFKKKKRRFGLFFLKLKEKLFNQ